MRSSLVSVSLLALAHLVGAQKACLTLTSLFPKCALPCVTSAAKEVGCAEPTDVACRCIPASSSAIQSRAVRCVIAACTNAGELGSAIAAGGSVCGCVATAVPDPTVTTTSTEIKTTTSKSTAETPTSSTTVPTTATSTKDTTSSKDTTSTKVTTSNPDDTTSKTIPTTSTTSHPGTTAPPTCNPASPCQASADAVPDCAETCIFSAAATDAGCKTDDFQCQCSSSAAIQNAAQGCVIAGCGVQTGIAVLNSVSALCDCVKANPTTPCTASGTKTSGNTGPTETSKKLGTDTTSVPATKTSKTSGRDDTSAKPTCAPGPPKDCAPIASNAIPGCAQACFTSAAPKIGCDLKDFACQCQAEAQASLSMILVPCVASACPASSLQAVITGAGSVCACATAPPTKACSPTGGGPGGSTQTKATVTTKTGGHVGGSTACVGATSVDCGPVASSVVPACAQACFSSAAPKVGCGVHDYACQCGSAAQASLSQLLIPCVATACNSNQLPAVITGASSLCACATAAPRGGGDCGSGGSGGSSGRYGGPGTAKGPGGSGGGAATTCVTVTKPGSGSDCMKLEAQLEPCATGCFSSAIPKVGCQLHDFQCQCGAANQKALTSLVLPCIQTACEAKVFPNIIAQASAVCACASAGGGGSEAITTTSCYPIGGGGSGGGATITMKPGSPTGGSGGRGSGSNLPPGKTTGPVVVVPGAAARFEIGVVAGIFGVVWLVAIAL